MSALACVVSNRSSLKRCVCVFEREVFLRVVTKIKKSPGTKTKAQPPWGRMEQINSNVYYIAMYIAVQKEVKITMSRQCAETYTVRSKSLCTPGKRCEYLNYTVLCVAFQNVASVTKITSVCQALHIFI